MPNPSCDTRLTVSFLASGSAGNATYVECAGRALLIDCGLSAREAVRRVEAAGGDAGSVEAVLLTHEHADHSCGVRVLARRLGVPVLATTGTLRATASALHDVPQRDAIAAGSEITVAGMRVRPFATSHDAVEPVGFVIESASGRRFGMASDTGVVSDWVREALADCHLLAMEANHDVAMLEGGPYPPFLKRRIRSTHGHLGNEDAASALAGLIWDGLHTVCGVHRSERNNTAALARAALARAVRALDAPVEVILAEQRAVCACAV